MFAAAVKGVATGVFGKGMTKKRAFEATGYHHAAKLRKIFPRIFLVPHGAPLGQ